MWSEPTTLFNWLIEPRVVNEDNDAQQCDCYDRISLQMTDLTSY